MNNAIGKHSILDSRKFPEDLKTLSKEELQTLASEIRTRLREIGDKCGGHLASNLGVVELTLALHTVFDSPKDKFLWDVSHQCYVHKMLTGRLDRMFSIKQYGGLSGFAKIDESEHDIFGAGHASTALSAGLGVAHGRDILGEDYSVVSVIGDASLSGGMSYEAVNNIDKMKGNFVCILNDNDMSISPPVGSMANYITKMRTKKAYDKAKEKFERIFERIPAIGVPLKRRIEKTVERLRNTLIDTKFGVMFEEFGFKYLGPLDGHDITVVMAALKYAKTYKGPIMIHLITKKGKGYEPAESDPVKYHGVSPKPLSTNAVKKPPTYTQVFGSKMIDIAKRNPNIAVITPAMREGSGLVDYAKEFPDRYFDVGIAEEHAVTFAAGLSKSGILPVVAIYSTFLQRGYDQLVHDVCLQRLPVIFALDRAGLVGADGPTHHGVFDYNYLLPIPHITILAPKDGAELESMMDWAVESGQIVSIRYPRGGVPSQDGTLTTPLLDGKAEVLLDSESSAHDITLLAAGSMAWPAAEIGKTLQEKGLSVSVINLRFIKPLDQDTIAPYLQKSRHVFVLEEGNLIGGVHAHILQTFRALKVPIHPIGIPDTFASHGTVAELKADFGMTNTQILDQILTTISTTTPA